MTTLRVGSPGDDRSYTVAARARANRNGGRFNVQCTHQSSHSPDSYWYLLHAAGGTGLPELIGAVVRPLTRPVRLHPLTWLFPDNA